MAQCRGWIRFGLIMLDKVMFIAQDGYCLIKFCSTLRLDKVG